MDSRQFHRDFLRYKSLKITNWKLQLHLPWANDLLKVSVTDIRRYNDDTLHPILMTYWKCLWLTSEDTMMTQCTLYQWLTENVCDWHQKIQWWHIAPYTNDLLKVSVTDIRRYNDDTLHPIPMTYWKCLWLTSEDTMMTHCTLYQWLTESVCDWHQKIQWWHIAPYTNDLLKVSVTDIRRYNDDTLHPIPMTYWKCLWLTSEDTMMTHCTLYICETCTCRVRNEHHKVSKWCIDPNPQHANQWPSPH